ncbi:choice-of-anchor C family PEP-CTERM protein [Phenylobacterium sp.]|uniref:choice-of-anchor C family PEP-CTERM protein n=1 Tax=Phenylobacterium sp. TaxID=1871053 RepID=UPI00286CE1B4|nr:choice-of-anchor C family protein [Phenylobacterium sp.]
MKMKSVLAAAVLVSGAAFAQTASAAVELITNGGFEAGAFDPGAFTTVFAGSTDITGWTVGPQSVDYIGSYWQASEGSRSVDLSGNQPGSISQTITTVSGVKYKVSFDLAGNPDAGPVLKAMAVTSVGVQNFNFDTTGASHGDMNWTPSSFTFVATAASTTLVFASLTGDAYGPALDNVSASAVPEPATWAMMIIGFGAVGAMARSRRRMALAA